MSQFLAISKPQIKKQREVKKNQGKQPTLPDFPKSPLVVHPFLCMQEGFGEIHSSFGHQEIPMDQLIFRMAAFKRHSKGKLKASS